MLVDDAQHEVEVIVHQLERGRVARVGVELRRAGQVAEEQADARDLEGGARAQHVGREVAPERGQRRDRAGARREVAERDALDLRVALVGRRVLDDDDAARGDAQRLRAERVCAAPHLGLACRLDDELDRRAAAHEQAIAPGLGRAEQRALAARR